MRGQNDFELEIKRAAGLTVDAACAVRTARLLPLPQQHRAHLNAALRGLEDAQDALFIARNDPWSTPKPRRHQQLELL